MIIKGISCQVVEQHLQLLPHASLRSELAGLKFFLMLSIFIFQTTTSVTLHACKQEQHHKGVWNNCLKMCHNPH